MEKERVLSSKHDDSEILKEEITLVIFLILILYAITGALFNKYKVALNKSSNIKLVQVHPRIRVRYPLGRDSRRLPEFHSNPALFS